MPTSPFTAGKAIALAAGGKIRLPEKIYGRVQQGDDAGCRRDKLSLPPPAWQPPRQTNHRHGDRSKHPLLSRNNWRRNREACPHLAASLSSRKETGRPVTKDGDSANSRPIRHWPIQ